MTEDWVINNFVFFAFVLGTAAIIIIVIAVPLFLMFRFSRYLKRTLQRDYDEVDMEEVRFHNIDRRAAMKGYADDLDMYARRLNQIPRQELPARINRNRRANTK